MSVDPVEFQKQLEAIKATAEAAPVEEVQQEPVGAENAQTEEVEKEAEPEQEDTVVSATQEDTVAGSQDDDTDDAPKIPRSRLNKEKQKRDEAEKRAQQEYEARIRLEEKLRIYEEKEKASNVTDDMPDPEFDPELYKQYQEKKASEEIKKRLDEQENWRKQQEQQSAIKQITYAVSHDLQARSKEQPDVIDAYNYLVDVQRKMYMPISRNEQELEARVGRFLLDYAVPALSKGISPADVYYQLAVSAGFKGGKKATAGAPDPKVIEENKKKTPSSTPESAKADAGFTGSINSIKAVKNENGRGVDPDKFAKMLKGLQK
jgi:hypothetical protein